MFIPEVIRVDRLRSLLTWLHFGCGYVSFVSVVFFPCLFYILSYIMCRFIFGMEMHSYSECRLFPGHDDIIDGSCTLCAYLVASWHGVSPYGRSPFPKYPC